MKTNYIFQKLSQISKKFPDLIAIRESTKEYSYKSFFNMATNISGEILSKKKILSQRLLVKKIFLAMFQYLEC